MLHTLMYGPGNVLVESRGRYRSYETSFSKLPARFQGFEAGGRFGSNDDLQAQPRNYGLMECRHHVIHLCCCESIVKVVHIIKEQTR